QAWLALQSSLISTVVQAVVVTRQEEGSFGPVAGWSRLDGEDADPIRLTGVLEQVIDEQCGLLVELEGSAGGFGIAYPLLIDEQLIAVVAMEVVVTADDDLQVAMGQLQWGIAWLELLYRRRQAGEDTAALTRLKAAVDLLAAALSEEHFAGAAMTFVTELAVVANCSRVSLGFLHGRQVRVEAVSNSADFGRKMNLTRAIALAMDEAILQRRELLYPPPEGAEVLILRDHEALSRQQNQVRIATFPLFSQDCYYAALTCERPEDQPFSVEEIEFFRAVAALVGPALEAKELNDRSLPVKARDSAGTQLSRLLGPHYLGRKLFVLLLLALVVFFSLAKGDYRLVADTSLEGAIRRVVVAPFDGYIGKAPVRAGDLVKKGALLCTLDNRDLRLEKLSRVSQVSQLQRQYQDVLAKHERAQANIIRAQLEQANAELALLETKLARTRLLAPFAGLVVRGDLSQRLGGAVQKGEVLFEITPLNSYRVILEVDERRIADVHVGQSGILVLSSLPNEQYKFTVSKITPITTAEDGRNFFRVEAHLETVTESLRPGMEGIGKIFIDRRKLISIWSRDLVEWLQLWAWTWLP
ncbi:MAG: HlyD family efflux transporter periplasmic adaptor subunit, partial [Deltaproteobacteria bacterium]|nr:HlyD family efflux transporter periplasmic adaptor subunit [Deltaproteobacteria bacterium]